jgi:hypothetical protein
VVMQLILATLESRKPGRVLVALNARFLYAAPNHLDGHHERLSTIRESLCERVSRGPTPLHKGRVVTGTSGFTVTEPRRHDGAY